MPFGLRGRSGSTWLPLIFYLALSVALFGRHVLVDPAGHCVCSGLSATGDPPAFMWALSWWPHAIAHGLNPFYSHAIWAPGGVNVATVNAIPGAALVLFPVTELAGVVVSYNVLAVLSPALSAFTAFVLCRQVTRRTGPALIGGLIFGFSSYELEHLTQHPNLFTIFFIPLFPLLAIRRLQELISRRRFVALVALLFIGQFLLSTELTFDVVLFGAVAFAAAYVTGDQADRRRLARLFAEVLIGGLVAAVIVSPYLWWAIAKSHLPPTDSSAYPLDPLNLVIPTPITLFGGHTFTNISSHFPQSYHFPAGITEDVGYVGVALLGAFGAFLLTHWRRRSTKLLAAVGATALILALGPELTIHGQHVVPAPWRIVSGLPLFKQLLPARFMVFVDLVLAVGIASWLTAGTGRARLRWAAVAVGLLLTFPAIGDGWWNSVPSQPRFIAGGTARRVIPAGATVLTLPYGVYGDGQLWQAEAGFSFNLAATYVLKALPPPYEHESAAEQMAFQNLPPTPGSFAELLRAHHVSQILLDAAAPGRWPAFLSAIGLHPRAIGGVVLYAVPGAPANSSVPNATAVGRSSS